MSPMHPLLAAHLKTKGAEKHWVFELDVDDTTTLKMSLDGVSSKTEGTYKRWLTSMSDLNRVLTNWRGGLEALTMSVEINDEGGRFTLVYGRKHRGKTVRCKLIGPESLPPETHFTWFVGVVDGITKSGPRITMGLRTKDDQFVAPIPKSVVSQYVHPNLPGDTDLRGTALPYVVGNHDSTGLDARGMISCFYIGTPGANRFQYEAYSGWDQEIVRVFSDNVEMVPATDYNILQMLSGDSRKITVVEFLVDQEDKEIVVDVHDTTSEVGPTACLQQTIADLGYGSYYGDHLDPTLAPINASSVASLDVTLVDRFSYGRGYYISRDRRTIQEVVKEFCNSYDALAFWGYDGKLNFIPWDLTPQNDTIFQGPGAVDTDLAALPVLSRDLYLSEPEFDVDPESTITRVLGRSGRRSSDESWVNSRSVVLNRDAPMDRQREMELPWQPPTAENIGNISYMIATASSGVSGFSATGAASIEAAVSQGPPPGAASNSIRAQSATQAGLGGGTAQFDIALSDVPEMVSGQNLTVFLTGRGPGHDSGDADTITVSLVIAGTPYSVGVITGITLTQHRYTLGVLPLSPATGVPFTRSELNGASLRVVWDSAGAVAGTKRVDVHQVYGAWSYTAAANVSPATLAVLSRQANRYREAPETMTVLAPLWFLVYELGDDIPLENPSEGWGGKPWSRGRGRLVNMRVGPGVGGVEVSVENVARQLTTFWLLGRSLAGVDGKSAAGDGMALLTPGCTVSVDRASPKYLEAPAGIGIQDAGPVVKTFNHCWPSDRWGTYIEKERNNELTRSSFVSGLTGLTQSAGSGTIEIDKTIGEQLFVDPTVTDGHMLITAGSPHSTGTRVTWATTGNIGLGNDFVVFSLDTKGSSLTAGDSIRWRLQRVADGFYWNDSTGAWQAGTVDNTTGESLSWKRYASKPIDVTSAKARTYIMDLSLPAGVTAGCQVRVGHVQLESSLSGAEGKAKWASSRILTDASAPGTRAADVISIDNDKDDGSNLVHLFPNDRGGLRTHLRLDWDSTTAATSEVFTIFSLRYDANNAWVLAYVIGSGWIAQARSGGVNYSVTVNTPVISDEEYQIDLSWTSSVGEWDKPLTLTMIVRRVSDGVVLGTSEVAYVKPVLVAAATFGLGRDTATSGRQMSGYIIEMRELPLPPSEAQMLADAFELAEAA